MKCIVRLYGFAGGAPRSLLQHLKALRTLGYDNIICLAHNSDDKLYKEYIAAGFTVIQRLSCPELWDSAKYTGVYSELLWEYRYIKKEKPDLIIALGEINGVFYSRICEKINCRLIIYIPGGQIYPNECMLKLWKNCDIICFSRENVEEINKYYDRGTITLISNRIDVTTQFSDIIPHYTGRKDTINVLIVSRIAPDKINSIKSTISILSKCSTEAFHLSVHIAGTGKNMDELTAFCKKMNNQFMKIELLGHVDDMTDEFRWSHIVAGKGRSVIEPIMMNRIGCVIGEDGKIAFCDIGNIEELYHYNFSGRFLRTDDSIRMMNETLYRIQKGEIEDKDILALADKVQKLYSSVYLKERLETVIMKKKDTNRYRYRFLWTQYCKFMLYKTIKKMVKK